MRYVKLIGIKLGDFFSLIMFEQNYGIDDLNTYNSKKKELEDKGLICILANVDSNLNV